jgi:hypothetical protein
MRLAADENFNNDIVRGLLRRRPDVDIPDGCQAIGKGEPRITATRDHSRVLPARRKAAGRDPPFYAAAPQ